MADAISASVGEGGVNQPADVGTVQNLLNKHGAHLAADRSCGSKTIQAIRNFQKTFLSRPDGRVDPGGATWRRLSGVAAASLVQLPQMCGLGYYSYSAGNRQYGTAATIKALREVAATFLTNLPAVQLGYGDISFAAGGAMAPHQSHQQGRHVDIRPLRKDNKQLPATISDQQYSRENTRLLVDSLLAHQNVKRILFNDTQIKGVVFFQGHHNHLHVECKA